MRKLKTAVVMGIGVAAIGGVGLTAANVSAWNGTTGFGGGSFTGGWNAYVGDEQDVRFDADVTAAIAAKYDLQTDEVAEVVEEVRDDQFNLLSEERLERLQQAVEDEKLTQEEYDYVVTKLERVDDMIDRVDDATGKERRELTHEIKDELRSLTDWMDEHDISVRLLAGAYLGLEHHK